MRQPLFSIIVPCFNHAVFLNDSIISLFAQTSSDWEAILVNDGSTDNTERVARELSKSDKRIKYIYQINQGLSVARNTGLKAAKGKYLLFLDADDWLESTCLLSYSEAIQARPDVDIFRCSYAYWDKPKGRHFHTHFPFVGECSIFPQVLIQNIGPCHSILIRRSFADQLGGFDPSLKSCEDWDFWIRAGKIGSKIYSIPEVLVAYRYVASSMSRNPQVMYHALTEVTRRAGMPDFRLPDNAPHNHAFSLDYPDIQKKHFIRMLGVMLHQGNDQEAAEWYFNEQKFWNWKLQDSDWKNLSSYLSWAYFFDIFEIRHLMSETKPTLKSFFLRLEFTTSKSERLTRMVFAPQLKKMNHIKYGRFVGSILNRISVY